MWPIKYKPKRLSEVVNQRDAKERLLRWLNNWKPGAKAALLYGPPGNGKTCTVEALANDLNLDLLEMNASDVRTRERIERIIGRAMRAATLFGEKGRIILIDEVDGLEATYDRGGLRAIMRIIKESAYPVVLTANDPWDKKLYELRKMCELIEFKRIPQRDIVRRLDFICRMEGVKAEIRVLQAIAARNEGDLRGAILDLETVAQGKIRITLEDLDVLGRRERETDIFRALSGVFKSTSALAAKLSVSDVDMDPDELFWWIEENIAREYEKPNDMSRAYDALAKADLFRSRVIKRQNWRMLAYMIDLMTAGVSQAKEEPYRKFTRYKRPERLRFLSGTINERRELKDVLVKLASKLHCSTRKVKTEFLPFLLFIMRKQPEFEDRLAKALNVERTSLETLRLFFES
ncbi:replication factor C large subunit [Candidatus Bathyarchaeota archaeon]|nr:MAG: replication factor C large subunit [Candidatus Bathyarchaeota archaeon]